MKFESTENEMKIKALFVITLLLFVTVASALASGPQAKPKLDGAYKYVSTTFPGGRQTEADAKGMIVVHGNYMAFVRAGVNRQTWSQDEAQDERTKKIIAAYQGLAATAGSFTINGNVITLQQVAQANPGTMGKEAKWEFALEGKTLKLKPAGNAGVEFVFEKVE
jgi:hypothetical protein